MKSTKSAALLSLCLEILHEQAPAVEFFSVLVAMKKFIASRAEGLVEVNFGIHTLSLYTCYVSKQSFRIL